MTTYLEVLNNARSEIGSTSISAIGIQNNSADSLIGVRATNKALAKIYKYGIDQDFLSRYSIISSTSGTSLLTSPADTWDTNTIRSLWYDDGIQRYEMILVASKEIGDNIAFNLNLSGTTNNYPKWWYIDDGAVYILPVPTAVYSLKVYYQGLLFNLSASQMTSTIDMPPDFIECLTLGIEAYLRKGDKDPEWSKLEGDFLSDLKLCFERNKFVKKNHGLQAYQLRRSSSYRL